MMEINSDNLKILKEWEYYTIEAIEADSRELRYALRLAWNVFLEFDANENSDEGIMEFQTFIDEESVRSQLEKGELSMLGCFHYGEIVGVIATRAPFHVALLFVMKQYHKHGIATKLIETALENYNVNDFCAGALEDDENAIAREECAVNSEVAAPKEITVNSSTYAVEIYKHMGFETTDEEQTVNGLRFTPMKKKL